MTVHWTYESCVALESLWKQGLSAQQCADALGSHTRMQVICKVNNMKLDTPENIDERESAAAPPEMLPARPFRTRQEEPLRALPAPRAEPETNSSIVGVRAADCFPKPAQGLSIGEISDKTCRWPHGDVGSPDFHFCGAAPQEGSVYCAEHSAIAYTGFSTTMPPKWFKQGRLR